MSIENQLADLTAAIKELTAAIVGKAAPTEKVEPPVVQKKEAAEKPAGKSSATKTTPTDSAQSAAAPPAEEKCTAAPDAAKSPSEETGLLDYETDVKPLFLKLLAAKGRDAGVAFIKSYKEDAGKLNDALTPEQYPEAVAKLKELLG